MIPETSPKQNKSRISLSIDLRIVTVLLLATIIAMTLLWRPWEGVLSGNERTITVTGESTISAEPDEYVFYPTYYFQDSNNQTAIDQAKTKNNELTAKLKELGVANNKIQTSLNGGYNFYYEMAPDIQNKDSQYNLQLSVTAESKDLAQKVQDYLAGTAPAGAVTPMAQFSDATRKELESKARDEATKNARTKAEQSAKNLGFSIKRVQSIEDGSGFHGKPLPYEARDSISSDGASFPIQPGENKLTYSVTVTYAIR